MTELSLDAIGLKHGTDKASSHHDYLNFYESLFAPIRHKPLKILEIGVLHGASIRTWREYFPNARVIGADIDPFARRFARDSIEIEYMDQSNLEDLVRVAAKHQPFDLIIDDGSHFWEHQTTTLKTLFPFVRPGGIYIVEDLQTNFGDLAKDYRGVAQTSCVDFLKSWLDYHIADWVLAAQPVEDAFLRTYGRAARTINFYKRLCAIEKRELTLPPAARGSAPLTAAPLDPRRIHVQIIAHVSHVGDVYGPDGYIDLGNDRFTVQGLATTAPEHVLEYRVRDPEGRWSPWVAPPDYAGTRGRAQLLTGAAFRLREEAKDRCTLRVIGRFVGQADTVTVGDGEDCVAAPNATLCGLQIDLLPISEP